MHFGDFDWQLVLVTCCTWGCLVSTKLRVGFLRLPRSRIHLYSMLSSRPPIPVKRFMHQINDNLFFVTWEHSPDLTRHLSWESVLFHSETDNWGEILFDGEMKMVYDVCSNGVSHAQSSNIVCTPTSVPISIQATRASAVFFGSCGGELENMGWGEVAVNWGQCSAAHLSMIWWNWWDGCMWELTTSMICWRVSPKVSTTASDSFATGRSNWNRGWKSFTIKRITTAVINISEELEMLSNYCLKGHFEC